MIGVLDIGLGNIASVIRMIEKVGGTAVRISEPQKIFEVKKLILPGVGNFERGMLNISSRNFLTALRERIVDDGIPVLGICLGMQLLCVRSEESTLPGLGFVNADVIKFRTIPAQVLKVPHMGWNTIDVTRENSLIKRSIEEQRFYFVHSYYVLPRMPDILIGMTSHGVNFCAAFQVGNIYGVQFHPEKSHRFGMSLMRQFVEL